SVFHDDGNYVAAIEQQVEPKLISGLGTPHVEISLDANGRQATGGVVAAPYSLVGSAVAPNPVDPSSPRRIFLEIEVTYPIGSGLTDTPDVTLTPDAIQYQSGPIIENDVSQRPQDMERPINPAFRSGVREAHLTYIASENGLGNSIGTTVDEELVSRDGNTLVFPRRVYGELAFPVTVTDTVTAVVATVDVAATEYGSSTRVVKTSPPVLSGSGQVLCEISYFAQDPIPNAGPAGGGYQITTYFRTNSPQTAGVKEGSLITSGGGVLPPTLRLEPLAIADQIWSGQVGMGSVELPYPYVAPLDQIAHNDGAGSTLKEWYFAANASISIGDFDASTGILSLHPFTPVDGTQELNLGVTTTPTVDAEFRAFYSQVNPTGYRPTGLTQPLAGPVRHKTFTALLARIAETTPGVDGGILFRRNEIVLVVLSQFFSLQEENTVRFTDANNRGAASVFRTKNLLILAEDDS
ncbi:MAG: hypothetical protein AAGM67_08280, partial [Bacteroidota bacterium]